jgi:hypothetical protein
MSVEMNSVSCHRNACHRSALVSLIALVSASFMLFASSEVLMASDDPRGVDAKLAELKSATEITLLIIPCCFSFYARVDKTQLPHFSCEYQITSGPGQTFGEVFDVIRRADIQYDDVSRGGADLRVGVIFRKHGEVLWEFYFDEGGYQKVRGFSGDRRISASADIPSQLSALLTHSDVVLTGNHRPDCPHS